MNPKNISENLQRLKRGFVPLAFLVCLAPVVGWVWAHAQTAASPDLWEPPGVKMDFESGEPGLTRDGKFVIDKKTIDEIRAKAPMAELRKMAAEVNADASKEIQITVAVNLAPWQRSGVEQNASWTGGIGEFRKFIAKSLLRKAGLADPQKTFFVEVILDTLPNGEFPRPFVNFSVVPEPSRTKAPDIAAPESRDRKSFESEHGYLEAEGFKHRTACSEKPVEETKTAPFGLGLGVSATSPSQPDGGPNLGWLPALDLYVLNNRRIEGFCSFTDRNGLRFLGAGVIVYALDHILGDGSLGGGVLYDQYKAENDAQIARARRIGPACQFRKPLRKDVDFTVSFSLRYVDWDVDQKPQEVRRDDPGAQALSNSPFSVLCPKPTPTPCPKPKHPSAPLSFESHEWDAVYRVAVTFRF